VVVGGRGELRGDVLPKQRQRAGVADWRLAAGCLTLDLRLSRIVPPTVLACAD
jgi:hypothetical protein